MVRNYVRKTNAPSYHEEEVLKATEKINSGEWTYQQASEITKIPKGTLSARISRGSSSQLGRPTALTHDEEAYLVKLITTLQDWGELCSFEDVMKYATEFVELMGLQSRFKSGSPTKEWYYGFVKRWSDKLQLMNSIRLEKSRAGLTKEVVDGWFAKLLSVLKRLNLLDKPSSIFNADESGFSDDPGRKVVLVKRGTKFANHADGTCFPPYIIYKALRLYDQWCPRNAIRGAVFNGTETGWINEQSFYDYLAKLFIPKTLHLPRPLLLIIDNHSTHLSIKTAKLAIKHQIHILCLPSHSTHLLQPLDVYTFKYVKTQWRNLLWEFNKSSHNKTLDKSDFVRLFAKLYDYALLPAHCAPAFAKAGIYPFDSRIVRSEKLINSGDDSRNITTNKNSLVRSLSIEYDDPPPLECSTSTTSTIIKPMKLIKYPSAPNLHSIGSVLQLDRDNEQSFYPESSASNQHTTAPVNETQSAILLLDDTIRELAQMSTEPLDCIQSSIIINPTNTTMQSSSTPVIDTTSPSVSTGKENHSLLAIEKIVEKFFGQTKKITAKKRLISREFRTSVTDLDELALASIKKKRTKTDKTKTTKKTTTSRKRKIVESPADATNASANPVLPNEKNSLEMADRSNNSTIVYTNLSSASNSSPNIDLSSFLSTTTLQPLQNLTSITMFRCHQCCRNLLPWEAINNCFQCNAVICWQCIGFSDGCVYWCNPCRNANQFQQYLPL